MGCMTANCTPWPKAGNGISPQPRFEPRSFLGWNRFKSLFTSLANLLFHIPFDKIREKPILPFVGSKMSVYDFINIGEFHPRIVHSQTHSLAKWEVLTQAQLLKWVGEHSQTPFCKERLLNEQSRGEITITFIK